MNTTRPLLRDEIDPELFWRKVDVREADECWLWRASTDRGGYGQVNIRKTNRRAHRVAFVLAGGELAQGMVIDHLCRQPLCVNPDHLEQVTNFENVARGRAPSSRAMRTNFCIRGHKYTPENTYWRPDGRGRACRSCIKLTSQRRAA